jgi:hypothetical protein
VTLTGEATIRANFNLKTACVLTEPASGMVMKTGAKRKVAATASVAGGGSTVRKVEFFCDGDKIGESASAPYACEWAATSAGLHVLTARATTGDGVTGSSAAAYVIATASDLPKGVQATGGLVTCYAEGGRFWTAHIFTNSGTLDVTSEGVVEFLVVGGGGGGSGGTHEKGGGGAGGFLTGTVHIATGTYAITNGAGGAGGSGGGNGGSGGRSSFGAFAVAIGGGMGCSTGNGGSGGSGGGLGTYNGSGGLGTPGQGHDGTSGGSASWGGGGGGAGSASSRQTGGRGAQSSITGAIVVYARGGDGGNRNVAGDGASKAANSGDGGDGGSKGGNGGSGIVIVRYVSAGM